MDDNGNREIGRHKPDQYRSVQWMMPQHQVKDHNAAQTVKFMSIIAERDNAIYERDLALSEKKTAQAERDMAIFQRDAAINDRNNAIIERDNAIAAVEYARDNNNSSNVSGHGNSPYDHRSEVFQTSSTPSSVKSAQQGKKPRIKSESVPSKKGPNKSEKKNKRSDCGVSEDLNERVNGEWRDDGIKSQNQKKHRKEWKVEDLGGLNEVVFDESTMPVPVCSCTGRYQPCYKWGNGGWQSACCTTTISMYPLPMMPNKRHARVNGRKMSGTVFSKLLSKMAAEGHDLSVPLDLKDHWSKHGTNRYITIK